MQRNNIKPKTKIMVPCPLCQNEVRKSQITKISYYVKDWEICTVTACDKCAKKILPLVIKKEAL